MESPLVTRRQCARSNAELTGAGPAQKLVNGQNTRTPRRNRPKTWMALRPCAAPLLGGKASDASGVRAQLSKGFRLYITQRHQVQEKHRGTDAFPRIPRDGVTHFR